MRQVISLFTLIIFCASIGCGVLDPEQKNNLSLNVECTAPAGYPSKYCVLSPEDLDATQEACDLLNNGQLKAAQLDSFGFITDEKVYQARSSLNIPLSAESLMIKRAERAVLKFKDYTGLPGDPNLKLRSSTQARKALQWDIRFQNQVYEGLEVLGTYIRVNQDSDSVYSIDGHWYPDIIIPDCNNVSFDYARESIVGIDLLFYGWGDDPMVFTVGKNTISNSKEIVVLPVQIDDCIELRVVWRIGIIDHLPIGLPSWYIFVDTTTGEVVGTEQLFVT